MKSTIIAILTVFVLFYSSNHVLAENNRKYIGELKIIDTKNQEHYLKKYEGKPVVLHFWATWCPPCIKELPELDEYYHRRKDEVNILPIIIMDSKSDEFLSNFKKKLNINDLPIYKGLKNINYIKELGVTASSLPFSVFVDKNGYVVDRINGVVDWKQL